MSTVGPGVAGGGGRVRPGVALAGRYRLRHVIATGGMAEVWKATDDVLGRPVAVKILLGQLAADDSFVERFRREAIAAARLGHPNIVATYDTGLDAGVAFIVMELVEAKTLREILIEQGPLAPGWVIGIGAQVADALDYSHRSGVVHRDVKPANILVCDDGRVKVADFGIAKAVEESGSQSHPAEALTMAGSIIGTAQYLAPEQLEDGPVDGRADIYGLGVVLYEILCGRAPFSGDSDLAVALQHLQATPVAPHQLRGDIPGPLEEVVLRAMARYPDARYQSAAQLRAALLCIAPGTGPASSVQVGPATLALAAQGIGTLGGPPKDPPADVVATRRRIWLVPVVSLALVVAVSLAVIGVLFVRSDAGQRLLNHTPRAGAGAPTTPEVKVLRALAFDPAGDGHEHDDELPNLLDGDPSTTWSTEHYADNHFGGLKGGVGFVLQLDGPHRLAQLALTSTTTGWTVEVYVADALKPAVGDWGPVVATKSGVGGDVSLDLRGRSGSAVLVWITDLGQGNGSVSIGDARLTG